jgi:hypothetical protein
MRKTPHERPDTRMSGTQDLGRLYRFRQAYHTPLLFVNYFKNRRLLLQKVIRQPRLIIKQMVIGNKLDKQQQKRQT